MSATASEKRTSNKRKQLKRVIEPGSLTTANDIAEQGITGYALGYSDSEQERLVRQAAIIAPIAERLFHEAGIGPGQRVLDLGSGLGDVAMLIARLVGSSGEVVGVERDANSIARAKTRATAAGLHNISFLNSDVNNLVSHRPFDAAVGRFILMYLPDSVSVLRSAVRLVRPGGVIAFQEPSWATMHAIGAGLPLWSRVKHLIHEVLLRSGANPEMGIALHRVFQEAGLPAPKMHLDLSLGNDVNFIRLTSDLICSLRPLAEQHGVSLQELGDINTLPGRICTEIAEANTVVSLIGVVSAWSRKPTTTALCRDERLGHRGIGR